MNKIFILIVLMMVYCFDVFSGINLIPYPQKIEVENGLFTVKQLSLKGDKKFWQTQSYAEKLIEDWNVAIPGNSASSEKLAVHLKFDKSMNYNLEAYKLEVSKKGITIKAASDNGCFYGLQTLRQLIEIKEGYLSLPFVKIEDYPNYKWRSYMLDEARYFYGKDFVKHLLDELAALKINKFHWHLTDDAGWRIEIKKYPRLTEVGAYRDSTQININGKKWNSEGFDGKPHGGFYTQEDIKEIIEYASQRGITIIPEIEMPGHSSAAIAAYPWLGVIGELERVPVKFGKLEDSYNIADPKVVAFLHDVLDEVCALFPSKVIHIGGDEVLFGAWKASEEMQDFMKKHNLKTPADAQIKFTNDISNYLASKGRRMMGWNEIMGQNIHGFENAEDYGAVTELSKHTVIHFWRGDANLIKEAAERGYEVVNSANEHTYLDYDYNWGTTVKEMYNWNPIPEGLEEKYHKNIIGVGAQMWTEWTPTYKDVEYMTFPRIAAIAEVVWSGTGDYENFLIRLSKYSNNWIKQGRNFPVEEIK